MKKYEDMCEGELIDAARKLGYRFINDSLWTTPEGTIWLVYCAAWYLGPVVPAPARACGYPTMAAALRRALERDHPQRDPKDLEYWRGEALEARADRAALKDMLADFADDRVTNTLLDRWAAFQGEPGAGELRALHTRMLNLGYIRVEDGPTIDWSLAFKSPVVYTLDGGQAWLWCLPGGTVSRAQNETIALRNYLEIHHGK